MQNFLVLYFQYVLESISEVIAKLIMLWTLYFDNFSATLSNIIVHQIRLTGKRKCYVRVCCVSQLVGHGKLSMGLKSSFTTKMYDIL